MIAIFPEIAAAAAAGDVDRLAILVRRYFCDRETFAPKPDVGRLMINAGMGVRTHALDTYGALLAKDERGAFRVTAVVSDRLEDSQRRFLLAHMLGHYLLEVQPVIARGDWQVSGYREAHCPAKRYAQGSPIGMTEIDSRRETLADEFAAALLLPRGMVRRAVEKIQDPERTAHFFGVSSQVLARRLADIGLAPTLPANFLDAERQIGGAAAENDPAVEPKAVVAPLEPAMPRSYAASTYGRTAKKTGKPPAASAQKPEAKAATPPARPKKPAAPPNPAGGGMERLREIARKMDKAK